MKQIAGFSNYFVTKTGKVYSEKPKKFLKSVIGSHKYFSVGLSQNGVVSRCLIHRLVLETFVGPCPKGMECRHLDGDRLNNRLDNLMWGTRKQNMRDRDLHGKTAKGERCGRSKLTALQVVMIQEHYATGMWTQRELAELFGVSQATIGRITKGESWIDVSSSKK